MTVTSNGAHVHKLIAKTAQDCCRTLFDATMLDNSIWKAWQEKFPGLTRPQLEDKFVALYWASCIEGARATLAHMLSLPTIDEVLKEEITDALIKDSTLMKGRRNGVRQLGRA